MNENPTIPEPLDPTSGGVGTATPPPPPLPMAPVRPQLRRSRNDRVISGLCGGLGRHFDVDPVLIRILVVVLTVFTGGAFLIAYILGWIIVPDDPIYAPVPMPAGTTATPSYSAGGTGTFVDPATGQVYGAYVAPAPVRVRTEPRSYLGLITLSAAVVVGGVLVMLGVAGLSIPAVVTVAAMLAVVGIGLLVGAFRGRARWLIAPALVLLLVAQIASFVPRIVNETAGSGVGDRRWVPTVSSSAFELGAGEATLDLGSLPPGAATVSARLGLGTLWVVVPADTRLVLSASVDLGSVRLPGTPTQSGSDLTVERTLEPLVTTGDVTTVELDAEVGLGELQVRRASS